MRPRSLAALLGTSIAVFLAELVLNTPRLAGWVLPPDAIEYLAIGNSWAHGTGFVDPVQWFYIPGAGQVVPAFAVRAPLVPFFIGVALWLGATVLTVIQLHAIWSAAAVGILVLGAARLTRLPTAAGVALWIGMFPAWVKLSHVPMTETTAVAMVGLVLLTLRGAARSASGAVLCGLLTIVAWLARPNLAGMAMAAFVAMLATPRPTLRHLPAWTYLATFGLGFLILRELTIAWTGSVPYSGYAILGLLAERGSASRYATEIPAGFGALLAEHTETVFHSATRNAADLLRELFSGDRFGAVGWLGAPGVLWCLWGGLHHRLERRFAALCSLGFGLGVILTLGYWDSNRYPLLSAVTAALCVAALLDDLCEWAARRTPAGIRRAVTLAPLVLALVLVSRQAPSWEAMYAASGWPLRDLQNAQPQIRSRDRSIQALCREIPRDVFVAGSLAWGISFWCGNPAIASPTDFNHPMIRRSFLTERRPAYFAETKKRPAVRGNGEVRLKEVASTPHFNLLRVVGVESQIEWKAPPPVGCAGRPSCLASVNR